MTDGRRRLVTALLVSLFAVVVLRSAWIHDDAYITLRTVDNFVNGHGLRWNAVDRVQSYTHPLWMLLVSFLYVFTREPYYTVIALSAALSVAAVLLVALGAAGSTTAAALGILVLTLSKAFVDYSTSGLENPLTHALYAGFLVVLFRSERSPKTLLRLSLIAALAAVNRMDTVLLYLPVLAYVVWQSRDRRSLAAVAAGFAPFVAWEAFSLIYYGFLLPNTAYAKLLDNGVSEAQLARQGLYYLQNSIILDPLTLLTTAAGILVGVLAKDAIGRCVAIGIAAYLAYVVWIGGDFVTGRFLTATLLGAVVLLSRTRAPSAAVAAAAAAVILVAAFGVPNPTLLRSQADGSDGRPLMGEHGIADERAYYYPYSGFLRALQHVSVANHPWAIEGTAARRERTPIAVRGDIGYFGFYAGPDVHVVDLWGLAEPLLARLPARRDLPWRIGHFTRAMPDGYLETLTSGRNQITDPEIAALYEQLALVTRGPLFAGRRWAAIWTLNAGHGQGR